MGWKALKVEKKKNVDLLLHNDQRLRPITSKRNGSWRVPGGLDDSYRRVYRRLGQPRPSHTTDQPQPFFDRHGIDRSGTRLFHRDVLLGKNRILISSPFDFHAQYFWTL